MSAKASWTTLLAIARRRRELVEATSRIASDNAVVFSKDDVHEDYKSEIGILKSRLSEEVAGLVGIVNGLDETVQASIFAHIRSAIALSCVLENQSYRFTVDADITNWVRDDNAARVAPAHAARRSNSKAAGEIVRRHVADFRSRPGHAKRRDGNIAQGIHDAVNLELEENGLPSLGISAIAKRVKLLTNEQSSGNFLTDDHSSDEVSRAPSSPTSVHD